MTPEEEIVAIETYLAEANILISIRNYPEARVIWNKAKVVMDVLEENDNPFESHLAGYLEAAMDMNWMNAYLLGDWPGSEHNKGKGY